MSYLQVMEGKAPGICFSSVPSVYSVVKYSFQINCLFLSTPSQHVYALGLKRHAMRMPVELQATLTADRRKYSQPYF